MQFASILQIVEYGPRDDEDAVVLQSTSCSYCHIVYGPTKWMTIWSRWPTIFGCRRLAQSAGSSPGLWQKPTTAGFGIRKSKSFLPWRSVDAQYRIENERERYGHPVSSLVRTTKKAPSHVAETYQTIDSAYLSSIHQGPLQPAVMLPGAALVRVSAASSGPRTLLIKLI